MNKFDTFLETLKTGIANIFVNRESIPLRWYSGWTKSWIDAESAVFERVLRQIFNE
jgi:hypothetical protein